MSNIERKTVWVAMPDSTDARTVSEAAAGEYRANEFWHLEGPFVRAADYQGAVREIDLLRDEINSCRECPSHTTVDAMLERSRKRFPPATGGR